MTLLKHGHLVSTPQGLGTVRGFREGDVLVRLDETDTLPDSPRRFSREAIQVLGCEWFLLCGNRATKTRNHPMLRPVPICGRCDRKIERLGT